MRPTTKTPKTHIWRGIRAWWKRHMWIGKDFMEPGEIEDRINPARRWDDE